MARYFVRIIKPLLRQWNATLAVLFILAMGGEIFASHILDTAELRLADGYLRHHADEYHADPGIVVIDADDQSLAQMKEAAGLWPWPREIHADLLEALQEFGPRAVIFDMAFVEPDMRRPKSDARLSSVISTMPSVYLPATLLDRTVGGSGMRLSEVDAAFGISKQGAEGAQAPLQLPYAVAPDAWRLGMINSVDDPDGVLRRYRVYADVQGWRLPSLPARVAADLGVRLPAGDSFMVRWPRTPHRHLPYGLLYLDLTERRPLLSAQDIEDLAGQIRGKIVVIGGSATSAYDHHHTPIADGSPGVDVLADALDNLMNGREVKAAPRGIPFVFGLVAIALMAFAFSRRVNPSVIGLGLAAVSAGALLSADAAMARDVLVPVVTPMVFAWSFYLFAAVAGYLRERQTRSQTVALLGRFLNPNVVRQLVDKGETIEALSGLGKNITVLFSDIRGFTTLSENRPEKEVLTLLNRYFARQTEVVFRHGGTLDKYIGDCIMAFWGAPLDDPDHARHAVDAALDMQDALLAFKRELEAEGSDVGDFDVGIGVHSGPAVVGFIGTRHKLDYTAIGDTVNLASRVEGLTKGVARVLVTKETMLACGKSDDIAFEPKGAFPVKGRAATVELYEPGRRTEQ